MAEQLSFSWRDSPRRLAIWFIRAYQSTASMRPRMCRYHPSCSEYTAQCILRHGVFTGVALGIRRILRCNPLSAGGYDPVMEQALDTRHERLG